MQAFERVQFVQVQLLPMHDLTLKKSPKERITQNYIEVRLEGLEKHWNLFNDAHYKILQDVEKTACFASKYYSMNLYQTTEDVYFNYKLE